MTNRQVVEEITRGDRKGCEHLLHLYRDRLLGEATHVFHISQEDAEELVSDTLLAVVNKIGTFAFKRGDGDFHYWVMAIFRNAVRDFVRREIVHRGHFVPFRESAMENEEEFTSAERDVLQEIVRRYESEVARSERDPDSDPTGRLAVLTEALDAMENWERVLLRCRALDVPFEEIAGYVGKPAKTLKVYHARVRRKLVARLSRHFPELETDETKQSR